MATLPYFDPNGVIAISQGKEQWQAEGRRQAGRHCSFPWQANDAKCNKDHPQTIFRKERLAWE